MTTPDNTYLQDALHSAELLEKDLNRGFASASQVECIVLAQLTEHAEDLCRDINNFLSAVDES